MSPEIIQRKQLNKKLIKELGKGDFRIPKYLLQKLNAPINVYDYRKEKLVFANERFSKLVEIPLAECYNQTFKAFDSWIHPEDLNTLYTKVAEKLMHICKTYIKSDTAQFTYTVNFRLAKNKNERERHVLAQCTVLEWDKNKMPAIAMNILSDISDHKRDHKMLFSASIFNELNQQWEEITEEEVLTMPPILTSRENEVMQKMLKGKCLYDISEELIISYYTVRTHCRNILAKLNCKSQQDLKMLAMQEGWI